MAGSGADIPTLRNRLASIEQGLLALRARPETRESWNFRDPQAQLLHDRLDQFLSELDFVIGRSEPHERLRLAHTALALADLVDAPASRVSGASWEEAARALRADPKFAGLELGRQRGLVPLGPDPRSGLWEFAHAQSGSLPERDDAGELVLAPDMAIVLVLVPPNTVIVGAQSADPLAPNFDPEMERFEGPTIEAQIEAFFLSKFEMTVAQWCRLSGHDPEGILSTLGVTGMPAAGLWPSVGMNVESAKTVLAAYSLQLPTSICWEYAARAGTATPWWCGTERASLEGACNVADRSWQVAMNYEDLDVAGAVPFDDGYPGPAPIGRFRPNAFGLHDTIGNAAEWCRDTTSPYMTWVLMEGNELMTQAAGLQIVRGGDCSEGAFGGRSAARRYVRPTWGSGVTGVRAMRRLDP
jgi:formylglycine-generating enzyme required for sulfatase activity